MKLNTSIYFFIITLILFTACNHECRVVKEYYENGNDKIVEYYSNCNDTSTYASQTFYENGMISSEGFFVSGVEHGKFKTWSEKGILIADWEMIDGMEHGFIQCWYENGIKKRDLTVNMGVKDGFFKEWDENGKLIIDGKYKNGEKDGKWTLWEEDGTWRYWTFVEDVKWGKTYEYLVDSLEINHVVGQYENNLEAGLWKWYDKDSVLYKTVIYSEGMLTGEYIEYFKNGNVKSKGNLINGKYDGEVIFYNEKGKIIDKLYISKMD